MHFFSFIRKDIKLGDGDLVITPKFNMTNAKYTIHAFCPDLHRIPNSFQRKKLLRIHGGVF